MFARPFVLPELADFQQPSHYLHKMAVANSLVRTIGFGAVFSWLAFFQLRRPDRQDAEWRPVWFGFWACWALTLMPLSWLPRAISATWIMRDGVAVFGILLAGGVLQRIGVQLFGSRLVSGAVIVQCLSVVLGVIPQVAGALAVNKRGIFPVGTYNDIARADLETPYVEALRKAAKPGGRFVATARASLMMDGEYLVDLGAINNVATIHGFAEVSFIAKGISFDAIRRSQSAPYGMIVGDRMDRWALSNKTIDWPRDDQALLTLLGIEGVVAEATESTSAPRLIEVAHLSARDGFAIRIYKNTTALPRAFVIEDARVLDDLPRRRDCTDAGIICRDVSKVVAAARTDALTHHLIDNGFRLALAPSAEPRTVIVTSPHRVVRLEC